MDNKTRLSLLIILIFFITSYLFVRLMDKYGSIDFDKQMDDSCSAQVIEGRYIQDHYLKGAVFFRLSAQVDKRYFLFIGGKRDEEDFYNYVENGDSICRTRDTMLVLKPNGERTKWLIDCANDRPDYQPKGFGKPKTPSK